jgi:hypothetical protein
MVVISVRSSYYVVGGTESRGTTGCEWRALRAIQINETRLKEFLVIA